MVSDWDPAIARFPAVKAAHIGADIGQIGDLGMEINARHIAAAPNGDIGVAEPDPRCPWRRFPQDLLGHLPQQIGQLALAQGLEGDRRHERRRKQQRKAPPSLSSAIAFVHHEGTYRS